MLSWKFFKLNHILTIQMLRAKIEKKKKLNLKDYIEKKHLNQKFFQSKTNKNKKNKN